VATGLYERTHVPGDTTRRVADVLISILLALLTLPVQVLAAVGSAIALRAWPFFTQERIGRDGEPFRFVKIRTLPPTTPAYVDKFELDLQAIPAFCRLLRRLHIDELPQLFLVLTGRMSLVGPRPEMEALHTRMAPEFASVRTAVRPGCTGLWQISESCADLIGASPEYDRFYLDHRSVRLDAWILFRTALKMGGLAGPITLDQVPRSMFAFADEPRTTVDLRTAPDAIYAESVS